MASGRKRKLDNTIPPHIDQSKLPNGIYWDKRGNGSWYIFNQEPGEKPKRKNILSRDAYLSDLHAVIEKRAGVDKSTLLWLCTEYEASQNFKKKAKTTRDSYQKSRKVLLSQKTKLGGTFGDLNPRKITRVLMQRVIDKIAAGHKLDANGKLIPTPTKAVHVLRYISVVFNYGANRGHCDINPAEGIEAPVERKQASVPQRTTMRTIIEHARRCADIEQGLQGGCPSYLWAASLISYTCRLRGIEVVTLTDSNLLEDGLLSNRRKGSKDNVTLWTPELRQACDHLVKYRNDLYAKKKKPIQLDPAKRPLIVSNSGEPLTKSAFDSAWQRMIKTAIKDGVITPEQRFSPHGFKHRGITDTDGNIADKQEGAGHQNQAMTHRYNHDMPRSLAAGEPKNLRKIESESQ